MTTKLIGDIGATKGEWCLLNNGKSKKFNSEGISPYFMKPDEIDSLSSPTVPRTIASHSGEATPGEGDELKWSFDYCA